MEAEKDRAQQQVQQRMQADRHTRRSMLRMLVVVSIVKNELLFVLPHAGSAAWWLGPLLMIPGLLPALLLSIMMRRTRSQTLQQLWSGIIGKRMAGVCCAILILLLLTDAVCILRMLVCLFTEGIGTEGTPFTLSVLTCGMLVLCLHSEGLPRGIHLLRWPILLMLAIIASDWASQCTHDRFYPIFGNGVYDLAQAVRVGFGVSWALPLLLTEPPVKEGTSHTKSLLLPVLLSAGLCLLITAALPHTLLTNPASMTAALIAPFSLLHGGNKTLGLCLLMLTLFLQIAVLLQCIIKLCDRRGRHSRAAAYGLAAALCASQLISNQGFWQLLQGLQSWFLLPMAVFSCLYGIRCCCKKGRGAA